MIPDTFFFYSWKQLC